MKVRLIINRMTLESNNIILINQHKHHKDNDFMTHQIVIIDAINRYLSSYTSFA